jgi:hypothetical protein
MSNQQPTHSSDFSDEPVPTVKDGFAAPIKPTDAAVLTGIMDGKSAAMACKEAGLAVHPSKAANYVDHIKAKYSDAQGNLLVELENVGVTFSKIADTIRGGLEATRPAKMGNQIIDKEDYATRHKYVETVLDIQGSRAPKHQVIDVVQTHEQTVQIVDSIRNAPDVLLKIRERLQQREAAKTIEVEAIDERTSDS